jgi:transcriptional regulator with XRE-family HTH domain
MKITDDLTDLAVLEELGARLAHHRIEAALTQAQLAERAGLAKRTVERVEAGQTTELATLIRLLRALRLSAGLDSLIPGSPPSPMALLRSRGRERQRVSRRQAATDAGDRPAWSWAD